MKSNSDDIVKRKLAHFEMDVPVGSWDAIQQALPSQKRGFNVVLWRRAAVAAVFITAVGTSAFWFMNTGSHSKLAQKSPVEEASYPQSESQQLDSSAQKHVIMPNQMIAHSGRTEIKEHRNLEKSAVYSKTSTKDVGHSEADFDNRAVAKPEQLPEPIAVTDINNTKAEPSTEKKPTAAELAAFEKDGQAGEAEELVKKVKENRTNSLALLAALPGTSNTTVNSPRSLRSATTTQDAVAILNASQANAQAAGYTQHYYIPLSAALLFNKEISKRVSLETGFRYTYLMSTQQQGSAPFYSTLTQRLHYLGVPVNLNYRILQAKRLSLYTKTGVLVEKNIAGTWNEEIKNSDGSTVYDEQFHELEKVPQWSVNVGVGTQYGINKWLNFYFEPATAYYFENGSSIDNVRKHHRFDFSLQAGFRIGL